MEALPCWQGQKNKKMSYETVQLPCPLQAQETTPFHSHHLHQQLGSLCAAMQQSMQHKLQEAFFTAFEVQLKCTGLGMTWQ